MLYLILCDEKFTTFVGVNGEFSGETSNKFCVLKIMNKRLFLNLIALTFAVVTFTMCNSKPVAVPSTPEEAWAELIAGNERFVNENDEVIGVLDIDSPVFERFDESDQDFLEDAVKILEKYVF